MIDATATFQNGGEARFGLATMLQLTTRVGVMARAEYDTSQDLSWMAGVTYTLTKQFSLIGSYDSDYGPGAGVSFRF